MGVEQASLLQEHLYLLHLSGYGPDLLVGGRGIARNDERWQYAVDLVHSGLASGVLGLHSEEWMRARGMKGHDDFVHALAKSDPFAPDFFEQGNDIYWLEPEIYLSKDYDGLIAKYGIRSLDDPLELGLVAEVLQIFERSGTSWGSGPKVAVTQQIQNSPALGSGKFDHQ